jgi:filamentous hemagglutinin family protein
LITGGTRSIDGSNLFHNFQQFNVDSGQIANFLANPGTQNILGRVTGGPPSLINGMLQVTGANANLFLMNPSGMVFGANASLNVPASFTATTANGIQFSNGWWGTETDAAQMTNLSGNPIGLGFNTTGTIVNAGNLTVNNGQQITLLGGTVVNTGTIEAPGGKVTIAAIPNEKLVRITPDGGLLSVDLPIADRNSLQSAQTGTPVNLAELLTGQDSTNTGVTVINGNAILTRSGEAISTQPGDVTVSGSISVAANSAKNAAVHILGNKVNLDQATIDASGNQGAGSVKIGGDYQGKGTLVSAKNTKIKNSTISANSNIQGDGGQIIIWSDENTDVQAKLSAKGGIQGGNGGLVETSSAKVLKTAGTTVDASATQGKAGTWLLDPTDLEVVNGPAGANQVSADTITSTLDTGTSVAIDTSSGIGGNGDITFTGNVNQTGSGNAGLSFTGRRMINNGGQINLTSTGGLTFNLNAVNPESTAPTSSIQAAHDVIGTVNGPSTINLGAGTYAGGTVQINKNLTLNGSGETSTILSGENARLVLSTGANTNVTLNDLSIQNGFSTWGAGIHNSGNLTVNRSSVLNNVSVDYAGGIKVNYGATLNLVDSRVANNDAELGGAGIFAHGTVSMLRSTLENNTTRGSGAGLFAEERTSIVDSRITNNQADEGGGGISNLGTLTVQSSDISSNKTGVSGDGGGIFNDRTGSLNITNSQFTGNQADYGGGVANRGIASIDNSTFRNNSTRSNGNDGVDGGAIRVFEDGRLTLTNSLIENNTASFGGGLEASDNAVVSISNSIFRGNEATRSGGGIQNDNLAQMTIDQTTIDGNRVLERGGGGIENKARLTVTNSTISNNQAITTGGGITQNTPTTDDPDPVELSLTNVTISGNQAERGGGVRVETGTATIASTTIANNTASQSGGGIYVDGGTVNVRNTIVATNNSSTGTDVNGLFNDLDNNLIGDSTGSNSFTNSQLVGTAANPIAPPSQIVLLNAIGYPEFLSPHPLSLSRRSTMRRF